MTKGPMSLSLGLVSGRKLDGLPDEGVHLVGTSPPYWTVKDYGLVEVVERQQLGTTQQALSPTTRDHLPASN